jgi:molybdopterin converting factor subunit 1
MKILLFGISKDIVGASSLLINDGKKNPTTVKELKQFISNKYPEFNTLSSLAIAVNSNYAEDTTLLQEEDEIAIIPPVSGG